MSIFGLGEKLLSLCGVVGADELPWRLGRVDFEHTAPRNQPEQLSRERI
jgi:hypothetical protein